MPVVLPTSDITSITPFLSQLFTFILDRYKDHTDYPKKYSKQAKEVKEYMEAYAYLKEVEVLACVGKFAIIFVNPDILLKEAL